MNAKKHRIAFFGSDEIALPFLGGLREAGVEVVDNVCSLMALEPGGIHWLHRKLLDISGKTPTPA